MNAQIKITSAYGFDHNWTLIIDLKNEQKSFYLGQDSKFINRVLNLNTDYVISKIKTREISEGKEGNIKLANFIVKHLKLTESKIKKLQPWELCCQ